MAAGTRAERRHVERLWLRAFVVALSVCALMFLLNVLLGKVRSANAWGLSYGVAAALLMLGAALLGVRRRTMRFSSRLGLLSSRTWLLSHVYGGALFLVLVLMHSGFDLPKGTLTWCLWVLSIWTVLSGLFGLLLQKWIPRVLSSGLSVEVLYDRIPELVDNLRERAEKLVATCGEPIQALYSRSVAPVLAGPNRRTIYYVDITGGYRLPKSEFQFLRNLLGEDERLKLGELQTLLETKLEIDAHYTLQSALRWWLRLHLPPSFLLVALLVVHVWTVIYY